MRVRLSLSLSLFFVCAAAAAASATELQCGRVSQLEASPRACFELESFTGASICVAHTNRAQAASFSPAAIALDRTIVIEYATLANAASMFGAHSQVCIDHWRRARCAAAFPLSASARICASTCARLVDSGCHEQFFQLDACTQPDTSADCIDLSSESRCSPDDIAKAPAPAPAAIVPAKPLPNPIAVQQQKTNDASSRVSLHWLAMLVSIYAFDVGQYIPRRASCN